MKQYKSIFIHILLSLIYLFIFIYLFGYMGFDIHYTDWCITKPAGCFLNVDITWNYINFIGFLNDSAPIPYYTDLIYPCRGSLLYVDYVPLIALFVKIFYKYIIHSNQVIEIQYAYWYGSLCFILQGILSFKVIKKFCNNSMNNIYSYLCASICSIFFVLSPILIFYTFPSTFTLCSHFLIILSFYPFVFEFNKKQLVILYFILGILSCSIMPYFLPVMFINLTAFVIYKFLKKENIRFYIYLILAFIIGASFAFSIFHGVHIDLANDDHDLGEFCANLNIFIAPVLIQANLFPVLNTLELVSHRYFAYAYLGGGILALILYAICCLFKNYNWLQIKKYIQKYKAEFFIFTSLFCFIFFISAFPKIAIGNHVIINFVLSEDMFKFLSVFRANGRFIWPDFYLIYFILFIFLIKNLDKKKLLIVLTIGLILQIYDLYPGISERHTAFFAKNKVPYTNPLNNDIVWNTIKNGKTKIISHTTSRIIYGGQDIHFIQYAIKNRMKMNNVILSRKINAEKFKNNLYKAHRNIKDDVIYVFDNNEEELDYIVQKTNLKNCYILSIGKIACTKDKYNNLNQYAVSLDKDSYITFWRYFDLMTKNTNKYDYDKLKKTAFTTFALNYIFFKYTSSVCELLLPKYIIIEYIPYEI